MNEKPTGFYKINTIYSVTLNPTDKYQFFGNELRFRKFRNFVYEHTIGLHCDFNLIIEISEPHEFKIAQYKGPRLHLHGTLYFANTKCLGKFLMHDYYKLLRWTSVDIDTIDNLDTWHDYMMKQHLIKYNHLSNSLTTFPKDN